jgi:fluoride exporter
LTKILIIGLGGFVGAVARYGISGLVHRWTGSTFPYGTLAVNVFGCLLIGILIYLVEARAIISPNLRLFLGIGLLGAFTTFSTFGYETVKLINDRQFSFAFQNVAANVILGLLAVWLAGALMRALKF